MLVRRRPRVLGLVVRRPELLVAVVLLVAGVLLVAVVLLVVAAIGGLVRFVVAFSPGSLVLVVVTLVRRWVLGERNKILGHEHETSLQ